MRSSARYRVYVVVGPDGSLAAWASGVPLSADEALPRLREALERAGDRSLVIGSGSHDEAPGEWATVSWHEDVDGRPRLESLGLVPDERAATLLARIVALRGGAATPLRIRRFAVAARLDYADARGALRPGRACPECGLRPARRGRGGCRCRRRR
jgi:hypothetical protein